MKGLLIKWVLSVAALYITIFAARWLGLGLAVTSFLAAFVAVAVLAIVNATIRPVLRLFAMPLNCLTLGIVGILINAMMFWLVAALDTGLVITGSIPQKFLTALFGSVVMGLVSGALNQVVRRED